MGDRNKALKKNNSVFKVIGILITFVLTTFAWIFFKIGTEQAIKYIKGMLRFEGAWIGGLDLGIGKVDIVVLIISLLIVFCFENIAYNREKRIIDFIMTRSIFTRCVLVSIITLLVLVFGIYGNQHDASYFIYRDF